MWILTLYDPFGEYRHERDKRQAYSMVKIIYYRNIFYLCMAYKNLAFKMFSKVPYDKPG